MEIIWGFFEKMAVILGPGGAVAAIAAVYCALELRREREAHDATRLRYEGIAEHRYSVLENSVEQNQAVVTALTELRGQIEQLQAKGGRGNR